MRRIILVLLAMGLVLGCVPYSDKPLSDPDSEKMDASIIGTWYWNENDNRGYLHIGRDEDSDLLRFTLVELDREGELDLSVYVGHTSSLGENRYLNVREVTGCKEPTGGYLFVKYIVRPDALGLRIIDSTPVKNAIQAGVLAGSVTKEQGDWVASIRIAAELKELQAFVLAKDKELFPDVRYMPKLSLPLMPPEYRSD